MTEIEHIVNPEPPTYGAVWRLGLDIVGITQVSKFEGSLAIHISPDLQHLVETLRQKASSVSVNLLMVFMVVFVVFM